MKTSLNGLNISNCIKLIEFICSYNQITNLDLTNHFQLKHLDFNNGNFSEQGLSMFSHLINLDELKLGN